MEHYDEISPASPPQRALLVSAFPDALVSDGIRPELESLGIKVARVTTPKDDCDLSAHDVVLFVIFGVSTDTMALWSDRAATAKVPIVWLDKDKSGWRAQFKKAKILLREKHNGQRLVQVRRPKPIPFRPADPPPTTQAAASPMRTFGMALREKRKQAGMTIKQFANLVGVSTALVGFWESNRCGVSAKNYKSLCDLFDGLADEPKPAVAKSQGRGRPRKVTPTSPLSETLAMPRVVQPPAPIPAPKVTAKPVREVSLDTFQQFAAAARALGISEPITIVLLGDRFEATIDGETCGAQTSVALLDVMRAEFSGLFAIRKAAIADAERALL